MTDRFFPNDMPDFIPETPVDLDSSEGTVDSFTSLLSLPYKTVSEKLKLAAVELKATVVKETWGRSSRRSLRDYTIYTGSLGTAYLLFKSYLVTGNRDDLSLCSEIINCSESAAHASGRITFICGEAGLCALGAVVAKHNGDEHLCERYVSRFKQIKFPADVPNELLYGRAGYLWACSFLNNNIGKDTISSTHTRQVVNEIIESGRRLAKGGKCPLMYEWHGKKYWGAAHGLAGIMCVLMDMELKPDEVEDVKNTLNFLLKNRFPSGNYPSSEGSELDRLVHWCHGAPGFALTLVKAAEVFGCEEFLKGAIDAGEVIWDRGLLKRVGICHGISGNTYVFLALYRLTGKVEYLYKAKAFGCFLYDRVQRLISEGFMNGGDRPYSLFEGLGGMAYVLLDMSDPLQARFPAFEL